MWKVSPTTTINQQFTRYYLAWVAFSVLFIGLVYKSSFLSLHQKWIALDESYSHGYLVSVLAIYWLAIHLYKTQIFGGPRWWAIPLGCGASFLWYFGWSTQMLVLEQLALPFMFYALLLSVLGWRTMKPVVIPLLFLLLTLPVWDIAIPVLRFITTKVVQFWITVSGIPAFVDGYIIELPYGTLKVAGGCAGLNFFMVGAVVGALNAHQNARNLSQWVIYLGVALLFSVIGNWARVYLLVLIAYNSDMQSDIVYNHGTFGWIIFAIVLIFYFLFVRWMNKYLDTRTKESDDELQKNQPGTQAVRVNGNYACIIVPVVVIGVLLIAPVKAELGNYPTEQWSSPTRLAEIAFWKKSEQPKYYPIFHHWDIAEHWRYSGSIELDYSQYIYLSQRQGKEMIYYNNIIAHEEAILFEGKLGLPNLPKLNYSIIENGYVNSLVLWNYQIGETHSSSDLHAKLMQFPQSLLGNTQNALRLVSIECKRSECQDILKSLDKNEQYLKALKSIWGE